MYVRLELLGKAEPTSKRAQGKETGPTREREQTAIYCSQSRVNMWDSLGRRCARLTRFHENTGIQFLIDSKTFLAWLLCLNHTDRRRRLLWTTQQCPLLLHGASLCPVTAFSSLGALTSPVETLPSTQPLACKIHGYVSSWETSPSLLSTVKTSKLVQWFVVRHAVLHKLLPEGKEAKGTFHSSLGRHA